MDLGEEGVGTKQMTKSPKLSSISSSNGSVTQSPPSPVITTDVKKRIMDHESLVTVRLSEPPSLHVNTSIPMNPLPSRRTVYGIDYTPTGIMTEGVQEEESSESDKEPETPVSNRGQNLQDELGQQPDSESQEEE